MVSVQLFILWTVMNTNLHNEQRWTLNGHLWTSLNILIIFLFIGCCLYLF